MPVEARALDDEPAQRLPQLDARGRARLPPELDDTPHLGDLVEERTIRLGDLGPAGEVHGLRPVEDERPPEVVGDEREDRREHAQRLDERVPERPQRSLVVVPEAAARAADVPVREIVEVRLELAHHVDGRDPALVAGVGVGDERVRPLDEPAVERLDQPAGSSSAHAAAKPGDVRVVDEELDRVPEGEELRFTSSRRAEAEQEVRGRAAARRTASA